jgi:hypothetical protein
MTGMPERVREIRLAKRITALAVLALVVASAQASAARGKPEHVPRPGYSCSVGKFLDSEIWASSTLDAQGVQIGASLEWRGAAAPGHYDEPRFYGHWSVNGPEPLALTDGSITLDWRPRSVAAARRPAKAWLELTTVPSANRWPAPPFSSGDKAGRNPSIVTPWGDLIAFARGAERLSMIVRDKRWRIVDQTPVDPALFTAAERRLTTVLGRLATMAADYRSKCEYVEDLDADYNAIII